MFGTHNSMSYILITNCIAYSMQISATVNERKIAA